MAKRPGGRKRSYGPQSSQSIKAEREAAAYDLAVGESEEATQEGNNQTPSPEHTNETVPETPRTEAVSTPEPESNHVVEEAGEARNEEGERPTEETQEENRSEPEANKEGGAPEVREEHPENHHDEVPSYLDEVPITTEDGGTPISSDDLNPEENMSLMDLAAFNYEADQNKNVSDNILLEELLERIKSLRDDKKKEFFDALIKDNGELEGKLKFTPGGEPTRQQLLYGSLLGAENNPETEASEAPKETNGSEANNEGKERGAGESRDNVENGEQTPTEQVEETSPQAEETSPNEDEDTSEDKKKDKEKEAEEAKTKPSETMTENEKILDDVKARIGDNQSGKSSNTDKGKSRKRTFSEGGWSEAKPNNNSSQNNRQSEYQSGQDRDTQYSQPNQSYAPRGGEFAFTRSGKRTFSNPFITKDTNDRFSENIVHNITSISDLMGLHNTYATRMNTGCSELGVTDIIRNPNMTQAEKDAKISKIMEDNPNIFNLAKDLAVIDKDILDKSKMAMKDIDIARSRGIDTYEMEQHLTDSYNRGLVKPDYMPKETGLKETFAKLVEGIKKAIAALHNLFVKKEGRVSSPTGPGG